MILSIIIFTAFHFTVSTALSYLSSIYPVRWVVTSKCLMKSYYIQLDCSPLLLSSSLMLKFFYMEAHSSWCLGLFHMQASFTECLTFPGTQRHSRLIYPSPALKSTNKAYFYVSTWLGYGIQFFDQALA